MQPGRHADCVTAHGAIAGYTSHTTERQLYHHVLAQVEVWLVHTARLRQSGTRVVGISITISIAGDAAAGIETCARLALHGVTDPQEEREPAEPDRGDDQSPRLSCRCDEPQPRSRPAGVSIPRNLNKTLFAMCAEQHRGHAPKYAELSENWYP